MTHFDMHLLDVDRFGDRKLKKWTHDMLDGLQKQVDEGKILVDSDGAAYFKESGNYLEDDICERLFYTSLCDAIDWDKTREALARQEELIAEAHAYRDMLHRYVSVSELPELRLKYGSIAS